VPAVRHPRVSDRPKQYRVKLIAKPDEALVRQSLARGEVVVGPVWEGLGPDVREAGADTSRQHSLGLLQHFGADSVTRNQGDTNHGRIISARSSRRGLG
jgi:hypothetical protein